MPKLQPSLLPSSFIFTSVVLSNFYTFGSSQVHLDPFILSLRYQIMFRTLSLVAVPATLLLATLPGARAHAVVSDIRVVRPHDACIA